MGLVGSPTPSGPLVGAGSLTTRRLLLRRWREADRAAFAAINADPDVMRHMPARLSRQESDQQIERFEAHFERSGFGRFAVERQADGAFLGFVGLGEIAFANDLGADVEIAWRLSSEAWGQGYASEAARACLDYAFGGLGLEQVIAYTVPANAPSWRVMERIGMRRDPDGDFDHPLLAVDHPLCRHVLYRARRNG